MSLQGRLASTPQGESGGTDGAERYPAQHRAALHCPAQHHAPLYCCKRWRPALLCFLSTLWEHSGRRRSGGACSGGAQQSARRRAAANMRALIATLVLSGQTSYFHLPSLVIPVPWYTRYQVPGARCQVPGTRCQAWYPDSMAHLGVYLSDPASALPHT